MSFTRLLLVFSLLLPTLIGATGGPGKPDSVVLNEEWMKDFLRDLEPVTSEDFATPMGEVERTEMAAMFAKAPVFSDRSDDIRKVAKLTGDLKEQVDKARGILDKVRDPLRQVSNLVDAQLANLPLGIRKEFGNVEVFLAIGEARLKATYAEVDLYLGLDLPNTEQDPIFMAKGIKWSRQSGFIGDVEMQLIADWGIDMQAGKSRLILHKTRESNPDRGSKVVVTCEGLQSAQIDGTVLLSRDWVVPVINGIPLTNPSNNNETDPFSTARVRAHFNGSFNEESGFYFETNIGSPFAFTGKEDVHIAITQVVVDYSSVKNATTPAMAFPEGYQSPFVNTDNGTVDKRWQGLYISGVKITLPSQFRDESQPQLSVGVPQIIIDDTGVSAHLYAANILPLGNKTVDEWAFSVDSVELKVMHSNFEKASITGLVNVPMLGAKANCTENVPPDAPIIEEDCLTYRATIRPNDYYFGIYLNREYCIPVFKAGEVVIEENTKIELTYIDNEMTAQAMLFGSISIDAQAPNGDASFRMDSLSFDSLTLRTQAPYFDAGVWDFPTSIRAQFKAFELGFREIHMAKDSVNDNGGRNCQLFFQAYVSVDSDFELDASGAFRLLGELTDTENGQKWKYRSLKLDAFSIRASTSSFTVAAALAFYGQDNPDPVWGSGFYGHGELVLKALPSGSVGFGAVAQFGAKDNTKYFMVDVMGVFAGAPIPVFPGLNLGAVGGGVYNNMTANEDFMSMETDGGSTLNELRDEIEAERDAPEPTSSLTGIVGRSLSGKQYTVMPGNFGIYVQLVLVAPNEEAYSITGRLEVEVNATNGWKASITASAQAMNPPNYSGNLLIEEGVGIYVEIAVKKVAEVVSFEATAEVFINVQDGRIVGINTPMPPDTSDRARFVSENGFAGGVYLKFSEEEWYLRVGTPTAKLGLRVPVAEAYAYFCVGDNVPPIPPLPDNVTAIVGDMDMSRDMSSISNASGFAFGAGLDIGSEGGFLIFRYNFNAGIGFDINIRNYGDAVCADDPNGPSIGVNGWYAAGQAWAYISGSLKVLGQNVASAGLATVLQLRGPKPTMARGVLAGYYQIGRGRKRSFRLDAQFGGGCPIVGRGGTSPFAGIDVISGSSIRDGATEVNTKEIPEIFTTFPMQERFDISNTDYRVIINENKLFELPGEELVSTENERTTGDYGFNASPPTYLKPNTTYRYQVEVEVQKWENSRWEEEKLEEKEISFTTGAASPFIDSTNIRDAYPYDGMVNLYTEEYATGEVQLYRPQPDITEGLTAVWENSAGQVTTSEVRVFNQFIRYDIPASLSSDGLYKLSLVQHHNSPGGSRPGGSLDAIVEQPDYLNFFTLVEERAIYECYFRTSRFRKFQDKVVALTSSINDRPGDALPRQDFGNAEGWSSDELFESEEEDPMLYVGVANNNTFPNQYLIDEVLPRFQSLTLSGSVPLGNIGNGSMQYANFENVVLSYPAESIYFEITDSTALPLSITPADFSSSDFAINTGGQSFVFGFSKIISGNLQRLKDGLVGVPEKVLSILREVTPTDPLPSSGLPNCTYCLDNPLGFLNFLNNTSSVPGNGGVVIPESTYLSSLAGKWSTLPGDNFAVSNCMLKRPVRMALRRMSQLNDTGYQGKNVSVTFRYDPPIHASHSVTRMIKVQ